MTHDGRNRAALGNRRAETHGAYSSFTPAELEEVRAACPDWEPTADHYPRLKMYGRHLTSDNVRLAHRLCNRRDYTWRVKINALLAKRMSLEEIAAKLKGRAGAEPAAELELYQEPKVGVSSRFGGEAAA